MISSTNYLVMKLVKTARAQDTKSVNDNSLNVLTETIRFRIKLNKYQCWGEETVAWLPYSAFYPVKRLHIVAHFHMPISTSKIGGHIVKGASLRGS